MQMPLRPIRTAKNALAIVASVNRTRPSIDQRTKISPKLIAAHPPAQTTPKDTALGLLNFLPVASNLVSSPVDADRQSTPRQARLGGFRTTTQHGRHGLDRHDRQAPVAAVADVLRGATSSRERGAIRSRTHPPCRSNHWVEERSTRRPPYLGHVRVARLGERLRQPHG
jgi:hypothetical protein